MRIDRDMMREAPGAMFPERRLVPPRGPARRHLSLAILLGVTASVLLVAQAALLAYVVERAFLRGTGSTALRWPLLAFVAMAMVRAAAAWGADVRAARAASLVRLALRRDAVGRLHALGPAGVARRAEGALADVLVGGIESTDAYVAQYLPQLALALLVPTLVGGAVAGTDLLSGIVLAVTFPLIPAFMYLIGAEARERSRRQWVALSRMSARFLDAVRGLATLKAFGASAREASAVAAASEGFRAVTMRVLRVAFLSGLVLELLATLGVAIIAVQIGLRLLYGHVGFQAALFVLVVAPEFYRPLRALGASFHAAMAGTEAMRGLDTLLPPGTSLPVHGAPGPAEGGPRRALSPPAIVFDRVTFTYPGRDTPALRDASLEAPPGATTALVGPSGSGKSTVAQLLLGFLEPSAGRIAIDGMPPRVGNRAGWCRQIAWVPQRPHLFHASVVDNLLIARPGATPAQVDAALRAAHADTFVAELPRGLATIVGERGERLSGGEAQRLALARAFLADTPVLVLDEPTAQLDPATEWLIADAIRTLRRGRTVLLIAHRLTTAFDADRIVVLSRGSVIETGTHAELVAAGATYARLVAAYGGGR